MRFSTEKSRDCLRRDERENVHRRQCHCRTCVLCRSHTPFDDVLLLFLLAVVLAEINQKETVHLPLVSVFSIQRPGVGRVSPGWDCGSFTSKVFCGHVGLREIGHVWVTYHTPKDSCSFPSFSGNFTGKKAFSFSRVPRALSNAVGNPATGILPVYRNSFGVPIETSKKSDLLGNQSREIEREREADRQTDRRTDRQTDRQTGVLFI